MYLIDAEILKFYELSCEYVGREHFFDEDSYSYNWRNIEKILPSKDLTFDYTSFQILQPVFKASHNVYKNFKDSKALKKDLKWFLKDLTDYEDLETLGYLLSITSSFEHEMGNVFHTHTKGTPVPHLLKDLLQYKGFVDIFGSFKMFVIRFLLGNPRSINLRNIIWHGFPYPSQIPKEFLSTLVLVIVNFSQALQKKNFEIKRRSKIEILRRLEFELGFETILLNLESKYILDSHKSIWKIILKMYDSERYFKAVLYILPQIELILRLIYKDLNSYDVSAKLDAYYITLDTIFEKTIPGSFEDNRIFFSEETISKASLTLLYDMFLAPNGLRLRDKIGHGEVFPEAVDKMTCQQLLFISNQLLSNKTFTYKSRYSKPCQVDKLLDLQIQNHENLLALNIGTVLRITRKEEFREIEIFHRSNSEIEVTNRVYNILEHLDKIGENMLQSYSQKLLLLENRELRSRNRRTLNRMIELFPEFVNFYGKMILYSELAFAERNALNIQVSEINTKLKKVNQIAENFEKYSHTNCNEWMNIVKLIEEFNKLM